MNSQTCVVLTHTVADQHIVRGLKADAIAVIIANSAVLEHGAKTAIKKNTGAPTTVKRNVFALAALDDKVLHARAFEVVTAHDRKNRRRLRLVINHAVSV